MAIATRNVLIGAGAALAAAALVVYVLFGAPSKPAHASYAELASGAMRNLKVLDQPPAQPDAVLLDSQGREHRLREFHGDVVLVNLWSTKCGPCIVELPTLAALHRRYEGRRFRVVPISLDRDDTRAEAIAELERLSGGALPFLQSKSLDMLFEVRSEGMPQSILYDAQGRELARVAADADWTSAEAHAVIDHALETQ